MIKVCHMTSAHQRYDGRIFRKECKSLSNAGYDVSLIVADSKGNEIVDKIKIHDVGIEYGRFQRIIKTTNKVKKYALKLDCDIYHFHDPELIFAGLSLKRRGKKVVYDMHENVPVDIEEKEYIPFIFRKLFSFLYKRLEIFAVKKFDGIVSTRESINERLKQYNQNIVLINNFPIIEAEIDKTNAVEINNDPVLCFAGAVAPNWQHKEIINAIESIDKIKYYLAGESEEEYLNELKKLKGWKKVQYMGKIPFSEVKTLYQESNVGLAIYIYCKNMDNKRGNLANTKLFEYMNYEIPIICTDFTLWKEIVVDECNCGICVNPYDVSGIREAINYLIENPDVAKKMGKNGKEAVTKKYNWDILAQRLIHFYDNISLKNLF